MAKLPELEKGSPVEPANGIPANRSPAPCVAPRTCPAVVETVVMDDKGNGRLGEPSRARPGVTPWRAASHSSAEAKPDRFHSPASAALAETSRRPAGPTPPRGGRHTPS